MKSPRILTTAALALGFILGASAQTPAAPPSAINPLTSMVKAPDDRRVDSAKLPVTYDGHSLMINGKRKLLISGGIHYPRSTPDMWPKMIQESKAAGLNCIETYVFWERHEREEGKFDFSGRYDLPLFLDLCKKNDMYVILRVGPYVCAEWNYGGLPWWLSDTPGLVTRTWNKPFMDAMERWVMELGRKVADRQITKGGPIILVQMENEYNNVSKRYGEEGQRYLAWAEELGHRAGFEVPMIMCEGASPRSIETLNGYKISERVEELHKRRPNQPALWTENWLAWYDLWQDKHNTRNFDDISLELMKFISVGGAGVNYYMWHGGTNFGRTAMYMGSTSYDYDAPLDEYGLPTEKLERFKMAHAFINDHSALLLTGNRIPAEKIMQEGKEVAQTHTITGNEGELVFVFNSTKKPISIQVHGIALSMAEKSVAVLEKKGGKYSTVYRNEDRPELLPRISLVPANIKLKWLTLPDTIMSEKVQKTEFKPVQLPHNMVKDTRDETDYGWYRTTVTAAKAGQVTLAARVSDRLSVWVNGQFIGTVPEKLPEDRKLSSVYNPSINDPKTFSLQIPITLKAGNNELLLLVSTLGMIKGDWMIDLPMSEAKQGLLSPVYLDGQAIEKPWSFAAGMAGERQRLYTLEGAAVATWKPLGQPTRLAWFRSSFSLTAKQIAGDPWMLDLNELGKGMVWINGQNIGRFWQKNGPQRYYHVPASWLKAGANSITVFDEEMNSPTAVNFLRRHLTYSKDKVTDDAKADNKPTK